MDQAGKSRRQQHVEINGRGIQAQAQDSKRQMIEARRVLIINTCNDACGR